MGEGPLTGTVKAANSSGTMAKRRAALGLQGLILEGRPESGEWFVLVVDASGVQFLLLEKATEIN